MVKQTGCEIRLNSNGVFYCGQEVSGSIVLSFYEKCSVKEVAIKIFGFGKCQWQEQRHSFVGEETYLTSEIKFFESKNEESVQIEPGVYTFGFECDLPRDLPTSCEGKFGFIRYLASVQVIRSKEPEQLQGCPFTVIKPYNLNADPIVQLPTSKHQNIKFFSLLALKSNHIGVTATIPNSGYAPGQVISIQLDVNNRSNRNIAEFKVDLIKIMTYFSTTCKSRKKHKKLLASVTTDGCFANTCKIFMPEFVIPPVPATDMLSSKILQISYEILINCNINGKMSKSLMKLPLVIGTVPLYSTYRCVHFEDSAENNHIQPLKHEALPMTMEMVLATTTDANTLPFIQCIECEKEESVGRRLRVCPNVVIKRFKCKECNELKRERIHYAHHSHYKIDLLRSA